MIVELLDTTTTAVNKKLDALREEAGVITMGRVGTLIIKTDHDTLLEESIEEDLEAIGLELEALKSPAPDRPKGIPKRARQ